MTEIKSELMQAIDWIDDFIARCNGDDRGSCYSVNYLRACVAELESVEQGDAFMEEVAYEHVFADGTKTLSYELSCAGFPPRTDADYVNLLYTNPVRKPVRPMSDEPQTFKPLLPCMCFDETSKRYCRDKKICTRIEALSKGATE